MNRLHHLSPRLAVLFLFLPLLCSNASAATAANSPGTSAFRGQLEQLLATGQAGSTGEPVRRRAGVREVYAREQFRPLWTPEAAKQLLAAIEASQEDGLQPSDYHRQALVRMGRRLATEPASPLAAEDDLLLTDALLCLGHDKMYGKVDPTSLFPDWNMNSPRKVAMMQPLISALKSGRLERFLARLGPVQPVYDELKQALAKYRAIAAQGGWPQVPEGPVLKPGVTDARIEALRRRLLVTGELTAIGNAPQVFDQELVAAVKVFQERHFLGADGVVGKSVLAALNVPVEARIDQIRVNLERARWIFHEVPPTFILVDIAGFTLQYRRDHQLAWSTRVVVGQPYHKTPVFRSAIRSLVLNPTWTVPTSIVNKELVPTVIKNPNHLREEHLRLFDANQREIPAATVNFRRYAGGRFPYTVRQDAGADNALGRIKFLFPNPYDVYLHDTPSKALFDKSSRAFSHGCIRVQNPLELGKLLLRDDRNNPIDAAAFDRILAKGETETLVLKEPVPIVIFYWTAQGKGGEVWFKSDPYQGDRLVLQALNGPPRVLATALRAPAL